MMRPALSPAAAGLLRGIVACSGVDRDRILLSDFRSVDWQSLTFVGERHEIRLRLPPPHAAQLAARLTDGLAEAEWSVPGQIVADVALAAPLAEQADGSVLLMLEALTIVE